MAHFPVDAPRDRVITALERLGFRLVREGNHIAMVRDNPDGTRTPLTMPNHRRLKGSTLGTILTQAGIPETHFWPSMSGSEVQPCAGLFPLCVSEPASVQAQSLSRAESPSTVNWI